ncbi:hypothetical protein AB0C96_09205 [Streptomyces sp. NPDC048506]|uniref:hypothetical protein n=1 Tax=Streptomyces sp. NPDC048506 TaxID=3155028 RepID=UPI0034265397
MTPRLTLRQLPYAFKVAADSQAVGPARQLVRKVLFPRLSPSMPPGSRGQGLGALAF